VLSKQEFGLGHVDRRAEALGEPTGKSHMVGVMVRHCDSGQRPAREGAGQQSGTDLFRRLIAEVRIDRSPTAVILDEKDVHVAQGERQSEARPKNPLGDFNDRTRRRDFDPSGQWRRHVP
jgi:hypothetical protein